MLWCYCPAEHDWVPDGWCEDICCEMCDESVKCWVSDEGEEATDDERDKLLGFLAELRDLCGKYGYEIGGCGCCGSPWLNTSKDGPTKTVDLYADGGEASVWIDGEGEVTTNER